MRRRSVNLAFVERRKPTASDGGARGSEEGADETRRRVIDAAVRCVLRWGVAKTGLADIAAEARCSRQTVYNHFPNAEAVIQAALLDASLGFADRMVETVRAFDDPGDRVVEAMMFCLEQLPNEPFLQLVGDPTLGKLISDSMFTTDENRAVVEHVAEVCLEPRPDLAPRAGELAEVMTRLVLSFLVLRGQERRSGGEMRAFLRRWLLPGILGEGAEAPVDGRKRPRRRR